MKKIIVGITLGFLASIAVSPATAHNTELLPRGTVIAYIGTKTSVPQGWEICGREGGAGFPDFGGRVLIGTYHLERVGKYTGEQKHTHGISIRSTGERNGRRTRHPEGADNFTGKPNWSHMHDVEGATSEKAHIPPAVQVLFLCKL